MTFLENEVLPWVIASLLLLFRFSLDSLFVFRNAIREHCCSPDGKSRFLSYVNRLCYVISYVTIQLLDVKTTSEFISSVPRSDIESTARVKIHRLC